MQSRLLVMGAAVLLTQLAPLTARANGQQAPSFAVAAPPPAVQANGAVLTLEQATSMAMSANPALRSVTLSLAISDGARLQAGLRPNPELSLLREGMSSNSGRTDTYQLSQALELGGKRGARIRLAEQDRALALGDVHVARADLRASVTAAYLAALTAQEHAALARQSLELAARASNAAGRRVAAGKISPLEQTRSRVAEAGARLELSQAVADAALARRRLAAFWGSTEPLQRELITPDLDLAAIPALSQLQARLDASPQMARARRQIARQQAQVELAKAERMPDLTLSLGQKKDRVSDVTQTVVGLSMPLPLFNRNQGEVLTALRSVDKAKSDAEVAYLRESDALADAHQRASLAQEQIDSMRKDILPAAQSAFDAAVTGFELGKFGFIDVLDAQRTLFQSRAQYLGALAARYRALADLQRYLAPDDTAGTLPADRTE